MKPESRLRFKLVTTYADGSERIVYWASLKRAKDVADYTIVNTKTFPDVSMLTVIDRGKGRNLQRDADTPGTEVYIRQRSRATGT